jgi:signal transduction histidine kinase
MAGPRQAAADGTRLHRPRRTARLRLTLIYAGVFLVLGTGVLVATYALAARAGTIAVAETARPAAPILQLLRGPVGQLNRGFKFSQPGPKQIVVRQRSADLRHLLGVLWVLLIVTTIGAAAVGWFVAGRFLRPLRRMTEKARTISAGNLGARLDLGGRDDEFRQLGDTLDDLLARLEASFESQQRFVANASHELRTPLTLDRTLIQVALADPNAGAEQLRATCEELLASGREQERLLEALLTLASSERGLDRREPLDLATLAGRVLATPRPEVGELGLEVESELEVAASTGDPALIERLIANLVDNAVRYNHPGGRLVVRTGLDAGRPFVSVANTGTVVPEAELPRLLEPFQRLGQSRTAQEDGHYGLGLSIARAIAQAHGAELRVSAQASGGLDVEVLFPAGATPF